MFKCQIDVVYYSTISEFFSILEKFDSPKIEMYINEGPAGGNCCVNLVFEDRNKCIEFLEFYYKEEDHDWILSQIF